MKIQITTTAKNVEVANFLLAMAIDALKNDPAKMASFGITEPEVLGAEKFRKQLIKGFTKAV